MKEIKSRKNIRLKGYDYSLEGYYFITICTQNRECVLSNVEKNVGADPVSAPTIGKIIQSYKTRTTTLISKEIHKGKIEPFNKKFWQRNYYEHIIRNEKEYFKIKEYIINNPYNWEEDEYY